MHETRERQRGPPATERRAGAGSMKREGSDEPTVMITGDQHVDPRTAVN